MKTNEKLLKTKKKVTSKHNQLRVKGSIEKKMVREDMCKLMKPVLLGKLEPRMDRHCGVIYRQQTGLIWT